MARRAIDGSHACLQCGYTLLRGADICPECGASVAVLVEARRWRRDLVRSTLRILSVPCSVIAGLLSATFVWGFIYGIGSRVIDDETYAALEGRVAAWGALAGLLLGVSVAARIRTPGKLSAVLLGLHGAALVVGCIAGSYGWRQGLYGFFGVHALLLAGVGLWVTITALQGRRRSPERIS
jgi:hypothetical protein